MSDPQQNATSEGSEALLADCYANASGLLPVAEAMRRVLAQLQPLAGSEELPLEQALGRVLAKDIHSKIAVPRYTNAAMDGYAICAAEIPPAGLPPVAFAVVGKALAGHPDAAKVSGPRQCVRIMTGAPLPAGTDTVVMQEHTVSTGGALVAIGPGHRRGQHVRQAGEDLQRGQRILTAGSRIGAAELGMIASVGYPQVPLRPRIRAAYFSTGDEINAPGTALTAGGIYDSNRFTVRAMLARLGVEARDLGVVRDERAAVVAALRDAAQQADVVITSGGVSTGEKDYIREALDIVGRVSFWRIAIRPGRPLAFGSIGNSAFFGLPGNPVAVMVTFYQFVQPALRHLAGESQLWPQPRLLARCTERLRKKVGRMEYYRAILGCDENAEQVVRSTGASGSGLLHTMHDANCFIVLPEDRGNVSAGDMVEVQPFYGLC